MKPGDTTIAACRGCGQPVLRGLNDEVCAWPVTLDLAPISVEAEIFCLATGREVCNYWPARTGKLGTIERRDPWQLRGRIAGRRPGIPGAIVLAAHECGSNPLPPPPASELPPPPPTPQHTPSPIERALMPPPY